MTPAARVQCAIDLLDAIIDAAQQGGAAADVVATRFFKERRYAGSGDRRAVRDLAWAAIRRFGVMPHNGRSAMLAMADGDDALATAFTGDRHAPAAMQPGEPRAVEATVAEWLRAELDPRVDDAELAALLVRAPLDLRIVRSRAQGVELPDGAPLPVPLVGLRLPPDTNVESSNAYHIGAIEVQDAASQWAIHACAVSPGMTVIDLCAGAGGKTLALAEAMAGRGRLVATDIDRARLQALAPRARRAGVMSVETRLLNPGQETAQLADLAGVTDLVLVDAPCSGSGTWRRSPEGRWRLTPKRLAALCATQSRLLDLAAKLVAPGGGLVYAVCSLLTAEGSAQVEAFLGRNAAFTADRNPMRALPGRGAGAGQLLTPLHDECDGFFVARLRRSA